MVSFNIWIQKMKILESLLFQHFLDISLEGNFQKEMKKNEL